MKVDFICLANSRKHNGRCVAGVVTDGGGWIRPVSKASDGKLLPHHYTLEGDREPQLLDVIEAEIVETRPEPHQPENRLLGDTQWKLIGSIAPDEALPVLRQAVVSGPDLFGDSSDRINFEELKKRPTQASLALVQPTNISWHVTTSSSGSRQIRANFRLGACSYDLVVIDPKWEERLSGLSYGVHPRNVAGIAPSDEIFLTISLGEPLYGTYSSGDCFKLVAAVLVIPG